MPFKYAGVGSRSIGEPHQTIITNLSRWLSSRHSLLRSGGATGADTLFDLGHFGQAEIFLPWEGYNGNYTSKSGRYRLVTSPRTIRKAEILVGKVMDIESRPAAHKCLFSRNCFQLLGGGLRDPVDAVIYASRGSRGTQVTVDLAEYLEIPTFNLMIPAEKADLKVFLRKFFENGASVV